MTPEMGLGRGKRPSYLLLQRIEIQAVDLLKGNTSEDYLRGALEDFGHIQASLRFREKMRAAKTRPGQ